MIKKRYLMLTVIIFAMAVWMITAGNIPQSSNSRTVIHTAAIIFVLCFVSASLCLKLKYKNYNIMKVLLSIILGVFIVSSGIIYPIIYNTVSYNDITALYDSEAVVFGTVCSEPKVSKGKRTVSFMVETSYISTDTAIIENRRKIKTSVMNDSETVNDIVYGSGIQFTAKLRRPNKNINEFNYQRYLLSQGCVVVCRPKSFELYQPNKTFKEKFLYFGHFMCDKISSYAEEVIPDADESALLKGILIGKKNDFSDELYENMTNSGFTHIAAVSGLHIMFLCAFMMFVLRRLPLGLRSVIIIPVLITFACIADFTPSVCRAVIMMSVMLLSNVLLRDADSITSLFFAAFVLMLANPYILYSTSFILSFSATLSLLVFIKPMGLWGSIAAVKLTDGIKRVLNKFGFMLNTEKSKRFFDKCTSGIRKFLEFFFVPIACQVFLYPISMYIFGKIGLGSILLNIIVIPCTTIVFVAGLINFAVYLIIPSLAKFVGYAVLHIPLCIIYKCAASVKNFSITSAQIPGGLTFILYAVFCIALYCFLTFYAKKLTKPVSNPENA